jgi:hypothetical protein
MDAKAVVDPRKIKPYSWQNVVSLGRRLGGGGATTYHRKDRRETSGVQWHLESNMDLHPPARQGIAVVPRRGPDLTTRAGDVGNGAAEQTKCERTRERNGCSLAPCGLIIDLQQRESTWGRDDFFDIDNHKQTSQRIRPCYSSHGQPPPEGREQQFEKYSLVNNPIMMGYTFLATLANEHHTTKTWTTYYGLWNIDHGVGYLF